jgi:hypothetical protein
MELRIATIDIPHYEERAGDVEHHREGQREEPQRPDPVEPCRCERGQTPRQQGARTPSAHAPMPSAAPLMTAPDHIMRRIIAASQRAPQCLR